MTRRRRAVRWAGPVVLGVAGALLPACSDGGTEARSETAASVTSEDLEPVPPGPPGEVLAVEELDEPTIDGTVWRVRYRSTSMDGEVIAVSGLVARPSGPAPDGGFPVLSWAHGTTGVGDACAPSLQGAALLPALPALLADGYVVAATDYEGLGTPGVHPYLVSVSEGRGVLDAGRAARDLVPETSDRLAVIGVSQGGHAALAAAELASEWAPELELVGTVAAAPVADVERMAEAVFGGDADPVFASLIVAGWADTYDDLHEEEVLGPDGAWLVELAKGDACVVELFAEAQEHGADEVLAISPLEIEAWRRRIAENTIDPDRVEGPVLLVQGTADELIPQAMTDRLHAGLCGAGVAVRYSLQEGANHGQAAIRAAPEIRRWLRERLDRIPMQTTCS